MEMDGGAAVERARWLEHCGLAARMKAVLGILAERVGGFWRNIEKLGRDDPRRIIHSLKVGFVLSLVSLFYYYQPLYDNFGVAAMWAVMTVVVVFEFSVGATLGKGVNRGVATLVAGALGVGAHHLASLCGHIAEPILLSIFVFLQAAAATFLRFYPKIKARYDYGLLIFILTFSLISVSGFRDDEIWQLAHKRLSTVLIGGSACVIISILVCPVWAGQDLHNSIANNLEKLADFLHGFGNAYFGSENADESKTQGYKSVLGSKSSEESLANFARWEPGHGRFGCKHPWKQYLKIGSLTRECAYRIDALNAFLITTHDDDIQAKLVIREKIEEECREMSWEAGNALKQLAAAIKTLRQPSFVAPHMESSKSAVQKLNSLLSGSSLWKEIELLEIVPVATVASLLIEVVNYTEKIAESVQELASIAHFKTVDPIVSPEIKPIDHQRATSCPHVVVPIDSIHDDSVVQNGRVNDAT